MRRPVGTSLYAGPSAFVLSFDRRSERTLTYRVIGSHLIDGIASLFVCGP